MQQRMLVCNSIFLKGRSYKMSCVGMAIFFYSDLMVMAAQLHIYRVVKLHQLKTITQMELLLLKCTSLVPAASCSFYVGESCRAKDGSNAPKWSK